MAFLTSGVVANEEERRGLVVVVTGPPRERKPEELGAGTQYEKALPKPRAVWERSDWAPPPRDMVPEVWSLNLPRTAWLHPNRKFMTVVLELMVSVSVMYVPAVALSSLYSIRYWQPPFLVELELQPLP
jgi:hypothetical protein